MIWIRDGQTIGGRGVIDREAFMSNNLVIQRGRWPAKIAKKGRETIVRKLIIGQVLVLMALALTLAATAQNSNSSSSPNKAKMNKNQNSSASGQSNKSNPSGGLIDINAATKEQLMTLPGVGDAYSDKIIQGRPYKMKSDLVKRGIIPQSLYNSISSKIVAHQPKTK